MVPVYLDSPSVRDVSVTGPGELDATLVKVFISDIGKFILIIFALYTIIRGVDLTSNI
jgi:hypothetical protein